MSIQGSPICAACPALNVCGDQAIIHTCRTCGNKVCNPEIGSDETPSIHEDCPKWNPPQNSAHDCGSCAAERDTIRRDHPRHARGRDALDRIFRAQHALKNALQEGRDPIQERAVFDAAMTDFATHQNPFQHLRVSEAEFRAAIGLVRQFLSIAQTEPDLARAASKAQDAWRCEFEWAEALTIAQRRRTTPEGIVREWVIAFTERAPWIYAWVGLSISRRRDLEREWADVLRALHREPLVAEG